MKTQSYEVTKDLYLVETTIGTKKAKKADPPACHHIAVIDCSYSMYSDLPRIREQLKKRLPKLLKETDLLSIIWFSSRGEHGVLLEAEPVASLTDLQDVNHAIDRWLKPIGLTGFKEPIEDAAKVVAKVAKKGVAHNLFFMSDGCDNQWARSEILKAVEKAADVLASATFVEYGYYADRPLLTAMAEVSGGSLIFAEDFNSYSPLFESAVTKGISGAPRIEVDLDGDPIRGFAFAIDGDALLTFKVEGGKVQVPEDLQSFAYLSPDPVGKVVGKVNTAAKKASTSPTAVGPSEVALAYAAVSLYSVRMQPNVVLPLLKALGDVGFIEEFSGLFGKDKYSSFMEATRLAAVGQATRRFIKGYDPKKVPKEDAFTVIDLLRILDQADDSRVLIDHPAFSYSRISRARVTDGSLSPEEQVEIDNLTTQLAGKTNITNKIAAIVSGKGPGLKFVADPAPNGYPISGLTFNETRPNISILVQKDGHVILDENRPDKVPQKLPTFIYRNYAIVRDGLINVEQLPIQVSEGTLDAIKKQKPPRGVLGKASKKGTRYELVVNLKRLPIINRKMVQETSAQVLFEKEFELACARAEQKVYNALKKEKFPRVSKGFEALYGTDAAEWLKERGITDYSGFNPKGRQTEAKDYYVGKELVVKLKGYASLPSVNEVKKRVAAGKALTGGAALMSPANDEIKDFLASDVYQKAKNQDKALEGWLDGQALEAKRTVRRLLFELAQIKLSITIGQVWFREFGSINENTLDLDLTGTGKPVTCTVELNEVEIKI